MSQLYLEKVELSNFRVYGNSFTLRLQEGPGVTLINGPNGMGKTTFFDGVEWALTGEVSRFQPYLGGRRRQIDPLTRFGAPEGSHRVSLHFTGSEPIDRGLGLNPTPEQIIALLKHQSWPEIGDLYLYLSITHFLGQSSAQRFSVKTPKEQWEALKGPAGIDRINFIRDKIGGQATRQAFTRAIRQATDELLRAQEDLKNWEELLLDRDRLTRLSASVEASAPAATITLCSNLQEELRDLSATISVSVPTSRPESIIEQLGASISEEGQRLTSRMSGLENLSRIQREYEEVKADGMRLALLETETEDARVVVSEIVVALSAKVTAAAIALESLRLAHADVLARVALLSRVSATHAELASAKDKLVALDERLAAAENDMGAIEARRADVSADLLRAMERLERRKVLKEALDRALAVRNLAHRLTAAILQMKRLSEDDPRTAADVVRNARASLIDQQRALDAAIASLEVELRQISERNDVIASAVATIVAYLSADDKICPVCASRFETGLLARALETSSRNESTVAEQLGKTLSARQVESADIRRQLVKLDGELVELSARIAAMRAANEEVDVLRTQLSDLGIVEPTEALGSLAVDRVDELKDSMRALEAELNTSLPIEELRALLSSVEAESRAQQAQRAAILRTRAETMAAIENAQASLSQHPELMTEPAADFTALMAESATEAASAAEAFEVQKTTLERAKADLEDGRRRAGEILARKDALRGAQASIPIKLQGLLSNWRSAGMKGEPDLQMLLKEKERAQSTSARIDDLRRRFERIVASYRRWLEDEELADRRRKIQARMNVQGVHSENELDSAIRKAVDRQAVLLARAQSAKQHADDLIGRLQSDADRYAEQVLRPLNSTIKRFSRALMTQADSSIFYRAEHYASRSELRPSIVRTDEAGQSQVVEMNPNLFFSEGQLSALSVSALLAASTTFHWSKWRALLMDDPLQHNDVIHASAFVDLLRQLVKRLHYQVILSTHDAAEASFMLRKCQSAGIPIKLCELIPHGDDGLVSEVA